MTKILFVIIIELPSSSLVSFFTNNFCKQKHLCLHICVFLRLFHEHFKWVLTPYNSTQWSFCFHYQNNTSSLMTSWSQLFIRICDDNHEILVTKSNWSVSWKCNMIAKICECLQLSFITLFLAHLKKIKIKIYININGNTHTHTHIYLFFDHFKWILLSRSEPLLSLIIFF